jgi:hypothetical protein
VYNGSLLYTIVLLSILVPAGMRLMCTIVAFVYNSQNFAGIEQFLGSAQLQLAGILPKFSR